VRVVVKVSHFMDRPDPESMHSPTPSAHALLIYHSRGRARLPSKRIQTFLASHSSPQKLEITRHPSPSIQITRVDRSNQQVQESMRSPNLNTQIQLLIRRGTLGTGTRNSAEPIRRLTGNRAIIQARIQLSQIPAPIRSSLPRRTILRLARLVVGTRLTTNTLISPPTVREHHRCQLAPTVVRTSIKSWVSRVLRRLRRLRLRTTS
jgi:hypothetical protein